MTDKQLPTDIATPVSTIAPDLPIAFIGGGNMASAIMGGLIRQGMDPTRIDVVEPFEETRERLARELGVTAQPTPGPALARAAVVVWAVKPQVFGEAAAPVAPLTAKALHLSVAAGIQSGTIAAWLGTERVVRAMPNTPALVGQGMTGLYAREAVSQAQRELVEQLLSATGRLAWMQAEAQLDAVTALSGSGPAYVFYFLEAMTQAGVDMGMDEAQAYQLAVATFSGATALAAQSSEPASVLRQRVTSKGGTTYAALSSMEQDGVKPSFVKAIRAAEQRARELGEEFGR
ncbi:pyrroline-5-carboxylate reductase [Xylophilus rhododendri]|uniref:Pyrroline-5-carboxylate reductase n=1 Tax=Xylophilus rhododendri TaxID=2697032 RepID=A0A857J5E9_9BURK|nr:pyrroline-5-carboxylate reductase [Xylophilus rhododendri]QHI99200.1 pyrroline-5-carboxylate reductase [Xylophilus rhododendri]